MSRLKGGLHSLKADPSARPDDQDCRHGVMLLVGPDRRTSCAMQPAAPQDGRADASPATPRARRSRSRASTWRACAISSASSPTPRNPTGSVEEGWFAIERGTIGPLCGHRGRLSTFERNMRWASTSASSSGRSLMRCFSSGSELLSHSTTLREWGPGPYRLCVPKTSSA
jgi:hypothetical protein